MPVSPSQGSTSGGTPVTITGTNLGGATAVHFGSRPATGVTSVSATQLTAVSPSGSGTVEVTVTTPGGNSNPEPFFYISAPWITSVSPAAGQFGGGNTVTITGSFLGSTEQVVFGPGAVHGGGQNAAFTIVSDTEIIAVAPPEAAGAADIIIQSPGGNADLLSAYTYLAGPGI
ncbi:IPT/TIG domain-containing protein [Streptomyces sp. NPDC020096]